MKVAELRSKYPKILGKVSLDCGDGWYALLDSLCYTLQSMTDNNEHLPKKFPQIEATQVKEKYGTLRFYVNGCSEWQDGVIDFAEHISGTICDICGLPGTTKGNNGWISTRCKEHCG